MKGEEPLTAKKSDEELLPAWIPISFALMFPLFVTWNCVLTKKMCSKEIGFDPTRMTYFTFAIMFTLIMIVSSFIWISQDNF